MKYDQRRNWFSNLSLIEVMEEQISKTRELHDIPQRENNLRITWLRETNRQATYGWSRNGIWFWTAQRDC